ncbi:MAG: methyltransferase domain-containing protein [Firmicutes bacterium]|nr:methyltransferase domain-containing protein [Bacillota bacterium]
MKKPLFFAQELLSAALPPGGYAVDATCGNGQDTVFLANLVGPFGRVLAMDVQEKAVENTRRLLEEAGLRRTKSILGASHSELSTYLDASPDAAVFNLGYLPGGDHSLVTRPETTLAALRALLPNLKKGGAVTIVVYTGHAGGMAEYEALQAYTATLPQEEYAALEYRLLNQKNCPPLLIAIMRL